MARVPHGKCRPGAFIATTVAQTRGITASGQMADVAGRLIYRPSFLNADQLSLTSLLTFLFGALVARIGNRLGHTTRLWLFIGTFIQCLFTMAASVCAWQDNRPLPDSKGDPTWTTASSFAAVGFMSATLGLQGVMSMRMKSHFGLTSTHPFLSVAHYGG